MTEPTENEPGQVEAAGADLSDAEMVEAVAGSTDSASEHASEAGKDWDGDPSQAPAQVDPSAASSGGAG